MSSDHWVSAFPIYVIAIVVFGCMALAAIGGVLLRDRQDRTAKRDEVLDETDSYLVAGATGVLALLMGFTFSLAIDRFETRRTLVQEEANAIEAAYLRTQLLEDPHRARIGGLLSDYVDLRLSSLDASAREFPQLLARDEALVTDLWAATSAAFVTIKGTDFSSAYLDSINDVISLDASRKAARLARVPAEVFALLVTYLIATSGVLGYVLVGSRGRVTAGFTLLLLGTSFVLILDIDTPGRGGVSESQRPLEALQRALASRPSQAFDRYLEPLTATSPRATPGSG